MQVRSTPLRCAQDDNSVRSGVTSTQPAVFLSVYANKKTALFRRDFQPETPWTITVQAG
jgi:hypothetical protein